MITEQGKRALLGYMVGAYPRWAGAIIIGVGTRPTSDSDKDMQFPVEISPVDVVVAEQLSQSVIARATFTPNTHTLISEVGLINDSTTYVFQRIVSFDSSTEFFVGGVKDTSYNRLGTESVRLSSAGTVTYSSQNLSLDNYSEQSVFTLALHNVNGSAGQVQIKLGQDEQNYWSHTAIVSAAAGYQVIEWKRSSFTTVGSPSSTNIRFAEFTTVGAADIVLDGLAIKRAPERQSGLLVARKILETPVQKLLTNNMDLEYKAAMSFG